MTIKPLLLLACVAAAATCLPAHAATACASPFQRSGTLTLPVNYGGNTASIYVPSGFRLNVGTVSASITIVSGARAAFEVATYSGGMYAAYPLPVSTGYGVYDRQTTQAMDLYADSGSPVLIRVYRNAGYNIATTARYALSGCLVAQS